jgi:pseudouridine-5'-phosphate glycosidase
MPVPQNVETALAVEALVRAGGAEPATIAIVDGHVRVGLEPGDIRALAGMRGVRKVSRADLPFTVASGATGATTVAATMICAALAGIGVFATGGIGGVHRGAETTLDISADLDELARTPVAVVCAGAKALLDLPKTLEVLETRGVPVICYRSDEFPAFWSRNSGLRAPLRLDSAADIAAAIRTQRALGYLSGTLIANPVDVADEIPAAEIGAQIERAVADANAAGILGKEVTPFLLDRLLELSGGRSLKTNIALIKSNARLAAAIAVELAASG